MEQIFKRTAGLTELPFHYCPGCTHGIIHRLIGEVLEELDAVGDTIGVAPVGCAGFSLDFFGPSHANGQRKRRIAMSGNKGIVHTFVGVRKAGNTIQLP